MIVPIHKTDTKECHNKGMTDLTIGSKIYERILVSRLTEIIESQLQVSQCGFSKDRIINELKTDLRKNKEHNY